MKNNIALQTIAALYNQSVGLNAPVTGHNVPVNHEVARAICLAYENLPAVSHDVLTVGCYNALAIECLQQYHFLVDAGYTFQPWQASGQPYANSSEMCLDLAENKHLYFFTGGEVHPMLGDFSGVTLDGIECSYTDIFRAVHDTFGHASEGYQFGPRGEENAWIHHSMMFTSLAQWALTTETRGQNSWVNENDANKHLPASEKPYAVQKVALLPLEYTLIPLFV